VPAPPHPLLIVYADDLGMSAGINRAIFAGHDGGIVTSTSLLATGAAFDEAIEGLASRPRLGVGVHLCLHEERPVLPAERIPSLVGADGRLLPLGQVLRKALSGRIAGDEVEAELSAQVERAQAAGVAVDHFDSHCHLHAFPAIARVVARVARRHGIRRIRRPRAGRWSDYAGAPAGRFLVSAAITTCSALSHGSLGPEIRTTGRFLGLVHSGSGEAGWVERALRSFADMPLRRNGEAVPVRRVIAILQGWKVTASQRAAQLTRARAAEAGGYVLALTPISQAWEPRLFKVPTPPTAHSVRRTPTSTAMGEPRCSSRQEH
jgi:predicted glycoside hydrolase/deacetylase ChbG (UPF0249 family)